MSKFIHVKSTEWYYFRTKGFSLADIFPKTTDIQYKEKKLFCTRLILKSKTAQ